MFGQPPGATGTDTSFPYTTLFRSVVERGAVELGGGVRLPEEAPEPGQGEGRLAALAQGTHDELEGGPLIPVGRAPAGVGQRTEAGEGVVAAVALLGRRVRGWVDEQVASFGDEEEQQPVDGAQELAVVVLLVERSILEALTERNVGWLGEEPFPQCGNGGLDAAAPLVPGPGAALSGLDRPLPP